MKCIPIIGMDEIKFKGDLKSFQLKKVKDYPRGLMVCLNINCSK